MGDRGWRNTQFLDELKGIPESLYSLFLTKIGGLQRQLFGGCLHDRLSSTGEGCHPLIDLIQRVRRKNADQIVCSTG